MQQSESAGRASLPRSVRGRVARSEPNTAGILLLGTGTRLFALGAQFVVLVVLARVLDKIAFGDAMTVFAFYRIASMGIGAGFGNLLLYHISREPANFAGEVRLHRTVMLTAAGFASVIGIVCALTAPQIAIGIFGKPSLIPWFEAFAPYMLFATLNTVAIGALDGTSRITEALVVAEAAPNALRLALLPLVPLLSLSEFTIAHIMTLSVALPWLRSALRVSTRQVKGMAPWTRWNAGYAAKYVVFSFSSLQLGGVDMLIVSALCTSTVAADYAVAARIAALFPFFQLIILRRFTPFAGRLIQLDDRAGLQREVDRCRRTATIAVALTAALILAGLPFGIGFLGQYQTAIPIVILLSLPPFVRSNFASCDRVLQIAGFANWGLGIMLAGLSIVVLVPLLVYQLVGIGSIPMGMLLSSLLLQPVMAGVLFRKLGLRTIGVADVVVMIVAIVTILGAVIAGGQRLAPTIATGFYLLVAVYMMADRRDDDGRRLLSLKFRPVMR